MARLPIIQNYTENTVFYLITTLWEVFQNYWEHTVVEKMCIKLLGVHYKKKKKIKSEKGLFDDVYAIFFQIFIIKPYVVGTRCKSMQFKGVPTTYA